MKIVFDCREAKKAFSGKSEFSYRTPDAKEMQSVLVVFHGICICSDIRFCQTFGV